MKPTQIEIGQPAEGIATITNANGADIYDSPNGQVLKTVPMNLYLPFFREYLDNSNNWYKVTLLDGSNGWLLANNNASILFAPDTASPLPLSPSTLNQAIITIDPGHGGTATGAVNSFNDGTQVLEKEANLAIALKLRDLLIAEGIPSSNIWMTRKNDIDVSLAYRSDLATASGGHLFVSIHNNASSLPDVYGTETYYQCGKEQTENTKTKSKTLADLIQQNLLTSINSSTCAQRSDGDRGVKCRLGSKREDYYYVLRNTFIPAILAECVFVSNEVEGKCLQSDSFQQLLAEGIRNGIMAYLI